MHQHRRDSVFCGLIGLLLLAGCATAPKPASEDGSVNILDTSMDEAMAAAEAALTRMQFVVEKADLDQGVIRTKPLTGAQFFEFWRSDNVGPADTLQANLHTLRRSVELRLRPQGNQVRIDCRVHVERLSLPANEIASISQAYRLHSGSSATIQRLELEPEQRDRLAWMDQGDDPALAERILQRIARRILHREKDETS